MKRSTLSSPAVPRKQKVRIWESLYSVWRAMQAHWPDLGWVHDDDQECGTAMGELLGLVVERRNMKLAELLLDNFSPGLVGADLTESLDIMQFSYGRGHMPSSYPQ